MGDPPVRRWLAAPVKAGVAAAILALLFARIPPGEVASALAAARPLPLLAAVGLGLAGQLGVAYRLRLLAGAHGLAFSTLELFRINLSALFYGLFVPGGNVTAGAVRLYRMGRADRRMAEAFSAILRDRLDAALSLAVVGIAFLAWDRPPAAGPARLALGLALAGCAAAWLLLFHAGFPRRAGTRAGRLPLGRLGGSLGRLGGALGRVRAELETAGRLPLALQARLFSISVAVHLMGVGAYLLLARSLAIDIHVTALGWIRSGVIFVTMIPVSLGGVGLREGAFLILLRPYGVAEEGVLALSFLVFAATVVPFGTAGGLLEARWLLRGGARRGGSADAGGRAGGRSDAGAGQDG